MLSSIPLFIGGTLAGSFLLVVARRYDPDRFIFSRTVIGGRSRCDGCEKTLEFFELIPLFSFLFQLGKCRACRTRLSLQYPLVEILCGLIFVFVPRTLFAGSVLPLTVSQYAGIASWILVFLTLLLVTLIDLRLYIIPDEANIFLVILGIAILIAGVPPFGVLSGSFLGPYALIFGLREGIFVNRFIAVFSAALLFGGLVFVTRGKGMGMGDVKLAAALAVVLGWPDILLSIILAFIIGSFFGLAAILARRKSWKSALPFGPFLALGATLVFFCGEELVRGYFSLFPG